MLTATKQTETENIKTLEHIDTPDDKQNELKQRNKQTIIAYAASTEISNYFEGISKPAIILGAVTPLLTVIAIIPRLI